MMSEEDKQKIGALYRKLQRQLALIETRLYTGLFGARKTNFVISHALEHRKLLRRNLLYRVKRIMRENGIRDYRYGFDEIDTKKKLTDKQVQKLVDSIKRQEGIIAKNKEALRYMEKGKDKRTLWKNTQVLEHKVMEDKIALWSHGYDVNGKQKSKSQFKQENAEFREAEEKREAFKQKMQEARANADIKLEGSRRQKSVRSAQARERERLKNSTPVLDSEIATNQG